MVYLGSASLPCAARSVQLVQSQFLVTPAAPQPTPESMPEGRVGPNVLEPDRPVGVCSEF